MGEFSNNERVEANYQEFEKMRRRAWSSPLSEVSALADRVRIAGMIEEKMIEGPTKRFYRAYAVFLDAIVEKRKKAEIRPSRPASRPLTARIRSLLKSGQN